MSDLIEKYKEREVLRDQIRSFWSESRTWTKTEHDVNVRLNTIHSEIVKQELLDETKPKTRVVYSVCGYSQRHGYFRSKRFQAKTIEEAKAELEACKKEPDWNIPTVIVKETYFRSGSPAMVDFDGEINNLGFSDTQEVIDKHMCGNRSFRWNDLISPTDNRFTY